MPPNPPSLWVLPTPVPLAPGVVGVSLQGSKLRAQPAPSGAGMLPAPCLLPSGPSILKEVTGGESSSYEILMHFFPWAQNPRPALRPGAASGQRGRAQLANAPGAAEPPGFCSPCASSLSLWFPRVKSKQKTVALHPARTQEQHVLTR